MTPAKDLPGCDERFAEIRGIRMRYLVSGSGPPVILVHGLGGAASNWVELVPRLARTAKVLVPELPGHGGSSPFAAAPNLNPYADRLATLLEREQVARATVVGHSFGGSVALRLAMRRPGLVGGLVLAGAAGLSSSRRAAVYGLFLTALIQPGRRIAPFSAQIARSSGLRSLVFGGWGAADPPALTPEATRGFLDGPAKHSDTLTAARALLLEDPRSELHRLGCPCLVLWGARDTQVRVDDAFEYARRLGAGLRVIADCGHLLIGERPDACVDAITTFLDACANV